ncbi:solvent efflux pump periplasmic linker SrpA [Microbulbifer aestuariivivens]|uniref:Solvent efflux pump periplasmic linker SrpA n=1 Tax=Microbulbifer aestuariivivens TaxID=1908308 RepID=A0ABP9WR46_9GAMM
MARIILSLLLLTLVAGCSRKEQPVELPLPEVEVLTVRAHQVIPRFEYVGRVEATDEFEVRPRVEGYIESRNFQEGQVVEQGELLYVIDPKPFRVALANQRARLDQAMTALEVAERNYQRGLQLIDTGAISQVSMDELRGTFEKARSEVEAVRADVENAQLNLSFTRITAPWTGMIGRSHYPEGALVGPQSEPLTTVVKLDPVFVRFEVPEYRMFAVQLEADERREHGQPPVRRDIHIKQPDGENYPYPGLIVFVDNQIDPTTGSVTVRARFPNPERLLVQGQFARVVIRVFAGEDSVKPLVPQAAVMEDMQGRFVFVVEEGDLPEKRYLKLGQTVGELWAVEEGIEAGQEIVVSGLQRVIMGKPLDPRQASHNPYADLKEIQPPPQQHTPDGGEQYWRERSGGAPGEQPGQQPDEQPMDEYYDTK